MPVSLGVGGSFDVYSEKLKRAPEYIQRSGLEWLYRVWQNLALETHGLRAALHGVGAAAVAFGAARNARRRRDSKIVP